MITWGCTDDIDWLIKIRTVRLRQLFASCFVRLGFERSFVRSFRVTKIGITRLTHVLRVSPKREFLFGFIQIIYLLLHFENEIDTDIYKWG